MFCWFHFNFNAFEKYLFCDTYTHNQYICVSIIGHDFSLPLFDYYFALQHGNKQKIKRFHNMWYTVERYIHNRQTNTKTYSRTSSIRICNEKSNKTTTAKPYWKLYCMVVQSYWENCFFFFGAFSISTLCIWIEMRQTIS